VRPKVFGNFSNAKGKNEKESMSRTPLKLNVRILVPFKIISGFLSVESSEVVIYSIRKTPS